MPESSSFRFGIAFGENHSPLVTPDIVARNSYYSGRAELSELESLARAQGGTGTLNEREPTFKQSGQMMGGGPILQYLTTLDLSFASLTALAFLKAARPILIEYLKNRRGRFVFKHGDLSLECEGVGCLDQIEKHLDRIAKIPVTPSTESQEKYREEPKPETAP